MRINRSTFELEPWLAERWDSSADGRTHTLHLRPGVTWSDGAPFTSADVVFSLDAVFDPKSNSVAGGYAERRRPADPRHGAGPADRRPHVSGAVRARRAAARRPADPAEAQARGRAEGRHAGDRLEFADAARRARRHWARSCCASTSRDSGWSSIATRATGERRRTASALPYLDRIVLEIVPEQNAELLRLQSGAADFTQQRAAPRGLRRGPPRRGAGQVKLLELGVGHRRRRVLVLPEAGGQGQGSALRVPAEAGVPPGDLPRGRSRGVRGDGVPRRGGADLGADHAGQQAVVLARRAALPARRASARELLKSIGLEDRNGNGVVEDAAGHRGALHRDHAARHRLLRARHGGAARRCGEGRDRARRRAAGVRRDDRADAEACNYDAIYMRPLFTDLDPAGNLDFWLSSGDAHFWNMTQKTPATEWERRIDTIMLEQAATIDPERRRALFNDVQRIFAENLPVLYFAAPRLYYAHSARLRGVVPSVMRPPVLWNADMLSVSDGAAAYHELMAAVRLPRRAARRCTGARFASLRSRAFPRSVARCCRHRGSSAALILTRSRRATSPRNSVRLRRRRRSPRTRARFDLDRSAVQQWAPWVGRSARFDFGDSFLYNRPVSQLLGPRRHQHRDPRRWRR